MRVNTNLIRQQQFSRLLQNTVVPTFVVPPQAPTASWELTPQDAIAPAQDVPQMEGISFGTFLAAVATGMGCAVLFDPKASKEAKAIAQIALGTSVPFLLNKAFDLRAWPGQQLN